MTTVLPRDGASGGEIVSRSVIDALGQAGEVRVIGYRRRSDGPGPLRPGEACVGTRPIETSGAGVRPLVWMARALASGSPYSSTKYRTRAFVRAARHARAGSPALVLLDHAQLHFAVDCLKAGQPLVFIAHNVESQNYARLADESGGLLSGWLHRREARLIEDRELWLARQASQVWTLTEKDAAFFRAAQPDVDVRTLEVASRVAAPPRRNVTCDIGLIGTWTWRPNALGLQWFAREVVPRLPASLRIEVAGRGADWLRDRYPNLIVRGVVPDAAAFLAQPRVIAIPSVAGAGVQIKTLDAIASGAPVVATPLATRGLSGLPSTLCVTDQPRAFAEHLARLAAGSAGDVPDPVAVRWSADRQARFTDSVLTWTQELTVGRSPAVALGKGTAPSN